jgi:hypothetical protein
MRVGVLLVALGIAGCAGVFPALEGPGADGAIAEALAAARAPAMDQKAALSRAQKRFMDAPSSENRLRLATLLIALPAPLRDDARAAELLEPIAEAGSAGTGRFAALLLAQIADRQRLAREVERLAREADRAGKEREKLDRERHAADKERDKREEALRQQLEALRSIERGILEREERLRAKPR